MAFTPRGITPNPLILSRGGFTDILTPGMFARPRDIVTLRGNRVTTQAYLDGFISDPIHGNPVLAGLNRKRKNAEPTLILARLRDHSYDDLLLGIEEVIIDASREMAERGYSDEDVLDVKHLPLPFGVSDAADNYRLRIVEERKRTRIGDFMITHPRKNLIFSNYKDAASVIIELVHSQAGVLEVNPLPLLPILPRLRVQQIMMFDHERRSVEVGYQFRIGSLYYAAQLLGLETSEDGFSITLSFLRRILKSGQFLGIDLDGFELCDLTNRKRWFDLDLTSGEITRDEDIEDPRKSPKIAIRSKALRNNGDPAIWMQLLLLAPSLRESLRIQLWQPAPRTFTAALRTFTGTQPWPLATPLRELLWDPIAADFGDDSLPIPL